MDNELLDLSPNNTQINQQQSDLLEIGGNPLEGPPVRPEEASQRAFKAALGLKSLNKDEDQLKSRIGAGQEEGLRREVSAELDQKKAVAAELFIADYAKKNNRPITYEEADHIRSQFKSMRTPTNPNTVLETEYAHQMTQSMYAEAEKNPTGDIAEATRQIPEHVAIMAGIGSSVIAKNEIMDREIKKLEGTVYQQSYIGYGVDFLKGIVPGYTEVKSRSNIPGSTFFEGGSGIGLGSNLEAQANRLLAIKDTNEFEKAFRETVTNLAKDNPQMALEFAQRMKSQTTSEKGLSNLFTGIEVATAPFVGTAAKLATRTGQKVAGRAATKELEQAVAKNITDIIKGSEGKVDAAKLSAAVGDLPTAAVQRVTAMINRDFTRQTGEQIINEDAINQLFRFYKPMMDDIKANPGSLATEQVNQLLRATESQRDRLIQLIQDTQKVERIPVSKATEKAVQAIKEEMVGLYPRWKNSLMDVSGLIKNNLTNTYSVEMNLAQPNGQMFGKIQTARRYAENQGIKDYRLQQQGGGFYITVTKPVDETTNAVRKYLVDHLSAESPKGTINSFVGMIRTPEDVLSTFNRQNRQTATYTVNRFLDFQKEEAEAIRALSQAYRRGPTKGYDEMTGRPIIPSYAWSPTELLSGRSALAKRKWKDFESMLRDGQYRIDPETNKPGHFYRSPGELQEAYLQRFDRLPDGDEIHAYFAFVRQTEMDAIFRELSMYKFMSRVGVENHSFTVLDAAGKPVKSAPFNGVLRKKFPNGEGTVLVSGGKQGDEVVKAANMFDARTRAQLEADVLSGKLQVLEIYDVNQTPLKEYSEKTATAHIRYVVSPRVETKPLGYDLLPRRGGGHIEDEAEHYLKQADVVKELIGDDGAKKYFRNVYRGDNTVMPVRLRAMGSEIAAKLDEVRIALRNKDVPAAQLAAKDLPIDYKEIESWFKPSFHPEVGKVPARLNLDNKIQVVAKNKRIVDVDKNLEREYTANDDVTRSTFMDGTREGSLANQYNVQFTGERDRVSNNWIYNNGTQQNPIYNLELARTMDPLASMDTALTRITNSVFMDDYKISSIEAWIKEHASILKATDSELSYAPFHHFNNPEFKPGADPLLVRNAQNQLAQINQFVGTPSKLNGMLHAVAQNLFDSLYTKFGAKAIPLDPSWMLPKLTDPFRFLRAATFHAAIGLFSPAQILVQAQTFAMIGAISPRAGSAGTYATMLHQFSRLNRNPAILDKLDEMATKLNMGGSRWRTGELKESIREMEKTGFGIVGGEHIQIDDMYVPKTFTHAGQEFLDAGKFFFRGSERNVRYGAWHTAYREFRDANPTKTIDNAARAEILQRADLLSGNMSRASASSLHSGVMQFPSQFLAYQIRVMELFWGKRLGETAGERAMARARIIGTYSTLYGIPVGVGVTGLPFSDYMRNAAQERGYVVGESWYTSAMEGLPAHLAALITGGGDSKKGNWYNIGERFGTSGFQPIKEALRGDESWWNVVGGAAFSKLAGTYAGVKDGFTAAMLSGIRDDGQSFPLKAQDFVDMFKEISTVNAAWKTYMGIHTGRWMSKKEMYTDDTSAMNAIFMGITGVAPQGASDLHIKSLNLKEQKELEKHVLNVFIKEMRRGFRDQKDNPDQAKDYFTRAFTALKIGGFPQERYPQAIKQALQDHESLVDRINWDYYIRKAPDAKSETRRDAYKRIKQLEDYKRGQ